MAYNRIVDFAERAIPPLAEMAGEMIKEVRSPDQNDKETAAEFIWSRFQVKHREPACQLMRTLFRPLDDWGKESAIAAATLLRDAFTATLDGRDVWDRRKSARTITGHVQRGMEMHVREWAWKRGITLDDGGNE